MGDGGGGDNDGGDGCSGDGGGEGTWQHGKEGKPDHQTKFSVPHVDHRVVAEMINDHTYDDHTYNDHTYNDHTYNDHTYMRVCLHVDHRVVAEMKIRTYNKS